MTRIGCLAAALGVLLLVALWWVVPANVGPLLVDCGGIPQAACDEHWRAGAADAVAMGRVPAGISVVMVRIDGIVGSGGYCASWTWITWSNGASIDYESFC
jgi:hypothetical protein